MSFEGLFTVISDTLEKREREQEEALEEEERLASEAQFNRLGVTMDEICQTTDLSPDQVRAVMETNADRFMFCRMPSADEAARDMVLYRVRRSNEDLQPGWSPGVEF